jgi:hypothetical protein
MAEPDVGRSELKPQRIDLTELAVPAGHVSGRVHRCGR